MRASTTLNVVLLVLIALAGIYYWSEVRIVAMQAQHEIAPCNSPVTYTITAIDPRFGVSTSTLEHSLQEAADIWNGASKKTLFVEVPSGGLVDVRLVYDTRQQVSQQLQGLDTAVGSALSEYNAQKDRYQAALSDYKQKKSAFDAAYAAYQKDAASYEATVQEWNARGGAPAAEYDTLQSQKSSLDAEATNVRSLESQVNAAADAVNALVGDLNARAKALNLNVAKYNTVGSSEPSEYQEAVFESAPGHEEIDVYEFDSAARLRRVLAHELGHALGLDHVDDPAAIMYRLNQSSNETPTKADMQELARICGR